MKITTIWNQRFGMLMASGSPGSALAYQLGSSGSEPDMMRRNIATGESAESAGLAKEPIEAIVRPAVAFEPSPFVSTETIVRAQREAHRLRAQVMQEMLGAASAWVLSLGRRVVSRKRLI